ncbi:MAG: adenosylmethionine--8-amino-7-oxononanoate transaminase [Phycisphaerae bacterium]|nr:adenosylmethionine--8-amino-7-oxononanoate transaminase [Phycisphaerae bacterium]
MHPRDKQRLIEWDRHYVWHPFTQHLLWNQVEPIVITGGDREFVFDADGRRYIDGHSSLWSNIHGHRRPEIDAAIRQQLDRIAHSTQLGLASPSAIELARQLVKISPAGLNKVFYSDDGSTSVEVACKLAYAYWQHHSESKCNEPIGKSKHNEPQRDRFIALRNAYHGDTLGAVSVGGIDLFHRAYSPLLFKTEFAPSPYCYRCPLGKTPETCELACANEIEKLLQEHRGRIAAVIIEPLVQAAAGMIVAPPGYLARVRQLCDHYKTLLIADEVATGFGRTGRMFACEHEAVSPDLLCVSKGLTGGYLPLAATLATNEIYDAFLGPIDSGRTFYHGHTFTGNPLGCAAALASLKIFEHDRVLEQLPEKIQLIASHLSRIAESPSVGDVRQLGMMAGIELVRDKTTRESYSYGQQVGAKVCAHARQYGLIVRPLADTIVILPPLCISLENLEQMMQIIARCVAEVMPTIATAPPADGLE